MPADRGTTALVAARFRAGAVLVASITQRWQHCLQPTQNWHGLGESDCLIKT